MEKKAFDKSCEVSTGIHIGVDREIYASDNLNKETALNVIRQSIGCRMWGNIADIRFGQTLRTSYCTHV
jgi:hypothetical protein